MEDSELEKIDDLAYSESSSPTEPHYPLDVAYQTKGLKSCPYVKVDKPPFVKKKPSWERSLTCHLN